MRILLTSLAIASAVALSGVAANAQTTPQANAGTICLTPVKAGAAKNCSFTSMAACEKAKTGQGDTCAANTGTTGSASGSMTAPSPTPAQNTTPKSLNTGK